jgi:hypothetical protein
LVAQTKAGGLEVGEGALAWVDVQLQRGAEGCSGAALGEDATVNNVRRRADLSAR